jgi:uncharacterized low-complexity protein
MGVLGIASSRRFEEGMTGIVGTARCSEGCGLPRRRSTRPISRLARLMVAMMLVPTLPLAAACGANERKSNSSHSTPDERSSPRVLASPTTTAPPVASKLVTFRTATGARLVGRVFGHAHTRAVVLAHQIDDDQSAWFDFARVLAASQWTVLTFNFEGYCGGGGCSASRRATSRPKSGPDNTNPASAIEAGERSGPTTHDHVGLSRVVTPTASRRGAR